MPDNKVYKVLQLSEWADFQESGVFEGSPVDHKDGYIHMSDKAQLQNTLDKHYTQNVAVILVEVQINSLAKELLKYEISRGGMLFPHFYGLLPLGAVSQHWVLKPDTSGRYAFSNILG